MSLPASEQQSLNQIEKMLLSDDPGLGSLLAVFTRLTRHEAMPGTEQVRVGLRQLVQAAVIVPVTLIILISVLVLTIVISGRQACAMTTDVARHSHQASWTARCPPGPAIPLARHYIR